MSTPTLKGVSTQSVSLTWTELTNSVQNGGDVPSFYLLEFSADKTNWYPVNKDWPKSYAWGHSPCTVLTNRAYYRLSAENGVGWGPVSSVLTVTASSNFTPCACDVTPTKMNICWSEGGDMWNSAQPLPSYYQLEWIKPTLYNGVLSCDKVPSSYLTDP